MSNPWEDFTPSVAEPEAAAPWEEFKSEPAPWEEFAPVELPKPRDILTEAFQKSGHWGSITSAMSGTLGRNDLALPQRDEEGDWDLPYAWKAEKGAVSAVTDLLAMGAQKLGAGNKNLILPDGEDAFYKVADRIQKEAGLTDEEFQIGWRDIQKSVTQFEDGEKARVLSDGSVLPNMKDSDWLDDGKAKAIIASLPISEEAKEREFADLKRKQTIIAPQKMEAYSRAAYGTPMEAPDEWADRVGRQKDFGTKEFVRDYEEAVAKKAGWGQGLAAGFHKGNLKLAMTFTGAKAMITEDEKDAFDASSYAYASSMLSEGSFDTGMIGKLQEELPSLIAIATITRGVGLGATAAAGSRVAAGTGEQLIASNLGRFAASKIAGTALAQTTKNVGVEAIAQTAATAAMLGTSFVQSAGATFASSIQEGDTIKEAKEKATKAGLTTAIVTGLFQFAGAGGLEKQMVGKNAAQMTVRDLHKAFKGGDLWGATATMAKQLGMAVGSEGLEEGIDEGIQAFVTADPDTNLADAWANAWDAAKIGGFIGGVAHVAGGEAAAIFGDKAADAARLTPETLKTTLNAANLADQQAIETRGRYAPEGIKAHAQNELNKLRAKRDAVAEPVVDEAAGVASTQPTLNEAETEKLAVLEGLFKDEATFDVEKAADLFGVRVAQPIAKTQANAATAPTEAKKATSATTAPATAPTPTSFSLGGTTFNATDSTPQATLEAVFGPAAPGKEWKSDVDTTKLTTRPDGRLEYDGEALAYAVKDGKVERVRGREAGADPARLFTQPITKNEQDVQGSTGSESEPQAQVPVSSVPTGEAKAAPPATTAETIGTGRPASTASTEPKAEVTPTAVGPSPAPKSVPTSTQAQTTAPLPSFSEEGVKQRTTQELNDAEARFKDQVRLNATDPDGRQVAELAQLGLDRVRSEIERRKSDPNFIEPQAISIPTIGSTVQRVRSNGEIEEGVLISISDDRAMLKVGDKTRDVPLSNLSQTQPKTKQTSESKIETDDQGKRDEEQRQVLSPEVQSKLTNLQEQRAKIETALKEIGEPDPDVDPGAAKRKAGGEKALAKIDEEIAALNAPLRAPAATDTTPVEAKTKVDLDSVTSLGTVEVKADGKGEIVGDNTPAGPLDVNVMVNTVDADGNIYHSRVVTGFYINENGEKVYTLSPLIDSERVQTSEEYRAMRPITTEAELESMMRMVDSLASSSGSNASTTASVEGIIRKVMTRIGSVALAENLLRFVTGATKGQYSPDRNTVEIDPQAWIDSLRSRMNGVSTTSVEAEMIVEDWIAEMEFVIFEELDHKFFSDYVKANPKVGTDAVDSLIEWARTDKDTLDRLYASAMGRYGHRDVYGGKLANITPEQFLDLMDGKEVNGVVLTKQQLASERVAISAEVAAAFRQTLRSGMSTAEMRAAADRFVVTLAGNPVGKDGAKLGTMMTRLTELLKRAIESMQRFMRAHRAALTLPTAFYDMSVALDQVMAGAGIVAPDPTRVMERFNQSAANKMAAVDSVAKVLSKRAWEEEVVDPKTGEKTKNTVSEFSLKQRVRDIMFHALSLDPSSKPVTFNKVTGKMEVDPRTGDVIGENMAAALSSAVDRLNNPLMSTMALEAAEMATDVRNVLRYMNRGIPTTARGGGVSPTFNEDILGPGGFDQVASILSENLITELEDSSGHSIEQILDQYNQAITNLRSGDNRPFIPNLNAINNLMATERPKAWAEIEDKVNEIDSRALALEEEAAAESKRSKDQSLTGKDKLKSEKLVSKLVNKAGELRDQISNFRAAQRLLINQYANYVEPDAPKVGRLSTEEQKQIERDKILRDRIRKSMVDQRKAERDERAYQLLRNQSTQTARSVGDLTNLSRDELSMLFNGEGSLTPGIDVARMEAALNKYQNARAAHARASVLGDHLEWALLGGTRPRTLPRASRSEERTTVGEYKLTEDGSRELLPLSAGRNLWGNPLDANLGKDLGTNLTLEVEDEVLGSYDFKTTDEFSTLNRDDQSLQVNAASRAVSGLFGYDPDESLSVEAKIERASAIRRNAKDIARKTTESFALARIDGDEGALGTAGIDPIRIGRLATVEEGGFPAQTKVSDNGTPSPVMPQTLMPYTALPEPVLKDDGNWDFPLTVASLYSNGPAAEMALSAVRFMKSIEGTLNNYSQAILWTTNGMTPAGIAYAAVTPRFLRFLALTKNNTSAGGNYQQMMIDYLTKNGRDEDAAMLKEAFDKLSTDFHLGKGFARERGDMKAIFNVFYGLRESMVGADSIYQESMHHAEHGIRNLYDNIKNGVTDDTRSPIDENFIRDHNFNLNQTRASVEYLRGNGRWGNVAISSLRPVSSAEALDELDAIEAENQELVFIGKALRDGKDVSGFFSGDLRLAPQSADQQWNTDMFPASTQLSNSQNDWILEEMRKAKENHMQREERVLTKIALMLYGGGEAVVRRAFNDPAFRSFELVNPYEAESEIVDNSMRQERLVTTPSGSQMAYDMMPRGYTKTVKHQTSKERAVTWNRTGIAQLLRSKLMELQKQEMEAGTVRASSVDVKNGTFGRNEVFDKAIDELLSRHGDQYRAMLEQIRAGGSGIIHTQTSTAAFASDEIDPDVLKRAPKFDSNAATVLHGLLSRIKNVTIITGKLRYDNMHGDEETRAPSLAFIPDGENPTLLLPYGKIEPTNEEATLAVEAALEWLHKFGFVNVTNIARPIVNQLALLNEPDMRTLRTNYRKAFENYRETAGIAVVTNEEYLNVISDPDRSKATVQELLKKYGVTNAGRLVSQSMWDAQVEGWTNASINQINNALAKSLDRESTDILSSDVVQLAKIPEDRSEMKGPQWDQIRKVSRKVLAAVLTNPTAKELFLFTSTTPNTNEVSDLDRVMFGNLIGYHNVAGMDLIAARNELMHFRAEGLEVTDEIGRSTVTVEARDGGFPIGDTYQLEELAGLSVTLPEPSSEYSPLGPAQAEWANATLYDIVKSMNPSKDPSRPLTGTEKPRKLSEFEARQLLSAFDHNAIAAAFEDLSSDRTERSKRWGNPEQIRVANPTGQSSMRNLSAKDLMDATGAAAENLQSIFTSWSHAGTYPGSGKTDQHTREQMNRYGTYTMLNGVRNRWEENRKSKGALFFAELAGIQFVETEGGTRYARVAPDLQEMEAKLIENGVLKNAMTPYDIKGELLPPGEDGKPGQERVNIIEAKRREVFAEHKENKAYIESVREAALEASQKYDNLEAASKAIDDALALTQVSINELMDRFSGNDPISKAVANVMHEFASNRDELARNLATDLISRVENANLGKDNQFDPSLSSAIGNDNELVRDLRAIRADHLRSAGEASRDAQSWYRSSTLVGTSLAPELLNYNAEVTMLIKDLSAKSPGLFGLRDANDFHVYPSDNVGTVRRKGRDFAGFINGIANPEWLMQRAIDRDKAQIMRDPLRTRSNTRSAAMDVSLVDAFVSLSESAQDKALKAISDAGVQFGQRVGIATAPDTNEESDSAPRRSRLIDSLSRIIKEDLYDSDVDESTIESLRSTLKAKSDEVKNAINEGKIGNADDVLKVLRAAGFYRTTSSDVFTDADQEAGSGNHLLRTRALVEMLRGDIRGASRQQERILQARLREIEESMKPRYKVTGWRDKGYASLELLSEANPNSRRYESSAQDAEIAYRVLNEYGKLWSRLYMRNYAKAESAIGLERVAQATGFADQAAAEGFGSFMAPQLRRSGYKVVDGLLEPEDMRERVEAVLRSRKAPSARTEVVIARLRNYMRNTLGEVITETDEVLAERLEKLMSSSELTQRIDLEGGIDSFESMIDRIRRGDYSKPQIQTFLTKEIASTKEQIAMSKGDATKRDERKALRRQLRQLEQRKAELEAAKEIEKEAGMHIPTLFAPAQEMSDIDIAQEFAAKVMEKWNKASASSTRSIRESKIKIRHITSGAGIVFSKNQTADEVTRNQMSFMLSNGKLLQLGRQLVDVVNSQGENVHDNLVKALSLMASSPMNPDARLAFYKAYNQAHASMVASADVEVLAAGYVRSANPAETTPFFRSFLHTSAKVTGTFAKSNQAIEAVNGIRSFIRKGAGEDTGKDRYLLQNQANNEYLTTEANKIDQKHRFVRTAQGYKLAQIESQFDVARSNDKIDSALADQEAAKSILAIMDSSEDALARANRQSHGRVDHSSNAFGAIANYIPRKLRQLYNHLFERGFHQRDHQYVELDMIADAAPLLEKVAKGEMTRDGMLQVLRKKWGEDAANYSTAIMHAFSENLKGYENVYVMQGGDRNELNRRPLVPFVWTNQSVDPSTSRKSGSMGDLLALGRSIWRGAQQKAWEDEDSFDLLDFDGITSPLRVLDDMSYRTMVAPAYDFVSEIVGDVSTASEHFSQYDKDENGNPKNGFIGQLAVQKIKDKNIASKAADGALAVSNMIRDELVNDMSGFSANNRAIALYRKIAIIGLTRKLFSLSQAYAQPLSPVLGYAMTNGKRGINFIPMLLKYWSGMLPGQNNKGYAQLIQTLVAESGPVIAQRGPDSNAIVEETLRDHRLSGGDLYKAAFLGRADGAIAPVLRAGGAVIDLTAKVSGKTLEWLIGRPEGLVLVPMLAHEIHSEVNKLRATRGDKQLTMDEFLKDPKGAGMTSRQVQNATVRVEQLFGASDRSEKGKMSQPSKTLHGEVWRSLLTTLSGHPITMAGNAWAAWRQIRSNSFGSKESMEGWRVLGMTMAQNSLFAFVTGPAITYAISSAIGVLAGWDDEERQDWEGRLYGIVPGEDPVERRTRMSYWVMSLLMRNEDPYGYSWHQGEFSEEQQAKHAGYRNARIVQELINQTPILGTLTSTTLGGSLLSAGMKAAGISPDSRLKQAGIILPEKWGFTGEAADAEGDAGAFERSVYLATKFWNNYLNDANSMAFAIDPFLQAAKMAANDPNDLDFTNVMLIMAMLLPTKPREVDRAAMRQHSLRNSDFEWAAPYER